jgi:hypothetical protein
MNVIIGTKITVASMGIGGVLINPVEHTVASTTRTTVTLSDGSEFKMKDIYQNIALNIYFVLVYPAAR